MRSRQRGCALTKDSREVTSPMTVGLTVNPVRIHPCRHLLFVFLPVDPLSDAQLSQLSDEQLIARVVAARSDGDREAGLQAIGMLSFHYFDLVRSRVALKVPTDQVDDVVNEILISAMKSSFDGRSLGEFHNWLQTITRRRIADVSEKNKRLKQREQRLPAEHVGEEEEMPDQHGVEGGQEEAELMAIVATCVDSITEPHHRRVIELYGPVEMGFYGLTARDTANIVNQELGTNPQEMTEANVHKIYQRFKDAVREALGEG